MDLRITYIRITMQVGKNMKQHPLVDPGMFSYQPPPGSLEFRANFVQQKLVFGNFTELSPAEKTIFFALVYYMYLLVVLGIPRTDRCDN